MLLKSPAKDAGKKNLLSWNEGERQHPSLFSISNQIQTRAARCSPCRITYQVDKVLITDLPIRIVVCQSQENLQLVRVQLGAVPLKEASKSLGADVSSALRVELKGRGKSKSYLLGNFTPHAICGSLWSRICCSPMGRAVLTLHSMLLWSVPG